MSDSLFALMIGAAMLCMVLAAGFALLMRAEQEQQFWNRYRIEQCRLLGGHWRYNEFYPGSQACLIERERQIWSSLEDFAGR